MNKKADDETKIRNVLAAVNDRAEIIFVREEGVLHNDHYREYPPERITICAYFREAGFGFGQIDAVQQNGKICINTEYMGREGVVHFLTKLLENAIYDTDDDDESHLEYNRIMNRSCGNHCKICNKT